MVLGVIGSPQNAGADECDAVILYALVNYSFFVAFDVAVCARAYAESGVVFVSTNRDATTGRMTTVWTTTPLLMMIRNLAVHWPVAFTASVLGVALGDWITKTWLV